MTDDLKAHLKLDIPSAFDAFLKLTIIEAIVKIAGECAEETMSAGDALAIADKAIQKFHLHGSG
jgi:hypothetical protein